MIDELRVSDYALIHQATLEFVAGCTVLSGETGAGKTALVGALKLLIGERGDAQAVRDGAAELKVQARFVGASGERIAIRRLSADGRSRCQLDDEMVTVGALAEQLGPLVELHGQHDHQALLSSRNQLAYLDRHAENAELLSNYQAAFEAQLAAQSALQELEAAGRNLEHDLAQAQFVLREIDAVAPKAGEHEELQARLPVLRNGEALADAVDGALAGLRGDGGALEQLALAQRQLERQAGIDPLLDVQIDSLSGAVITAEDVAGCLRAYRETLSFDPQALEQALDRLGQLEGLRRRFGPRMEDVFAAREQAARQLELSDDLPQRLQAAQKQLAEAESELLATAGLLAANRQEAARRLDETLTDSLQDLAMTGAAIQSS
ncbi:MAG: DNA repair protein RecN, partial [Coriobacteriales bacterium]|nr:DNA repair protein RecN [Coriobacteriales bacterium]